jgi:ribonuclease P protein component
VKRLFREFYRRNKKLFRTAFDMVVIARKNPGKKFLYEEAAGIFQLLAREAGILA